MRRSPERETHTHNGDSGGVGSRKNENVATTAHRHLIVHRPFRHCSSLGYRCAVHVLLMPIALDTLYCIGAAADNVRRLLSFNEEQWRTSRPKWEENFSLFKCISDVFSLQMSYIPSQRNGGGWSGSAIGHYEFIIFVAMAFVSLWPDQEFFDIC